MKPHEERVVKEYEELEDKIQKLETFLDKPMPEDMDQAQYGLLQVQLKAMETYSQILVQRIRLFK